MTTSPRRHLAAAAFALGLIAATACTSGTATKEAVGGTPPTSPAPTPSSTTPAPTSTMPAPTAPPTQAPVVTKPRPTTPAPTGPQLSNVALSGYPGGITCTPGDVLTITLTFTATNAAGVLVWSSTDGNIGQFPAEFGQADVPYTCSAMQTLFTLYPVAEGGALGTQVNLEV